MKLKMVKRFLASVLIGVMALSLAACGEQGAPKKSDEKEKTAEAGERPEAVPEEDWEAMQKEPVFGTEINYLFNGGACVSAKYLAEKLGYYEEYGINATYLEGSSVVDVVGTGQCQWGTDHIATMLVPVTNGVNMTFVCGAHMGCKSIYVFNDSDIKTAEDLKGKTIAIHDGIGNSDQNTIYRLLDTEGVNPTQGIEYSNIEDSSATVAAMENGEVDASIFSDYFVISTYKDKMRKVASITPVDGFTGEVCCVTAMNNDFIKENPVHAKYVVKAIKRAGQYARLNPEEAVQILYDNDKMTGEKEDQLEFWNSLHFGLSDAITEQALGNIASDYIRLGVITNKDMTAEKVMDAAWNNICPDEEIEDLTVGDTLEVEGRKVPVKQLGE